MQIGNKPLPLHIIQSDVTQTKQSNYTSNIYLFIYLFIFTYMVSVILGSFFNHADVSSSALWTFWEFSGGDWSFKFNFYISITVYFTSA